MRVRTLFVYLFIIGGAARDVVERRTRVTGGASVAVGAALFILFFLDSFAPVREDGAASS